MPQCLPVPHFLNGHSRRLSHGALNYHLPSLFPSFPFQRLPGFPTFNHSATIYWVQPFILHHASVDQILYSTSTSRRLPLLSSFPHTASLSSLSIASPNNSETPPTYQQLDVGPPEVRPWKNGETRLPASPRNEEALVRPQQCTYGIIPYK